RSQRGQRRHQRGAAGTGRGLRRPAFPARVPARRRGHVRAAQGGRRAEVLHPGRAAMNTRAAVEEAERWTAHNYHPLPVVIADAQGAWVTDVDGKRYLDCLAGSSALNFGHRHPALIAAVREQLDRVTLTSRAFLHDQFGPFCRELAELCDAEMVLPMNTG